MSAIYAWIKSVVACVLLLSLLQLLIPEKYERYMRLFTGIVLILVLVRPLPELLADSDNFAARLGRLVYDNELALLRSDQLLFDDNSMVEEQLRTLAGEAVDQVLEQYPSYKRRKLEIDCEASTASDEFGVIRQIRLWLTVHGRENDVQIEPIGNDETGGRLPADIEVERLRRDLAACFQISPEQIDIRG